MVRNRSVLLVQLPIPPVVPQPIRGNVPLAAGYLALFARQRGLDRDWSIDLLPSREANELGDHGLAEAILAREPGLVGFTCYLWNIERTLFISQLLKERRPHLRIVVGGPEVTPDNSWVLENEAVDYAVVGEGERTFADLLAASIEQSVPPAPIEGLFVRRHSLTPPVPRAMLARLDEISSPYLAGILDAADEEMLLLETVRGCIFRCKFCYYPKSYDGLAYLSQEKVEANLRHAVERGAREVVLLDPTLNQRRDFAEFLAVLARCNPRQQFTYFGELRAEGIDTATAGLLRAANFSEVEVGLQSVGPQAQRLMDRKNHLRAFERGVRAMLDQGIRVKVDLIIGLPGDTADSIREGMRYLRDQGLYSDVQVFQLAVLPGTAFRQEAPALGLRYQPRPPYTVLQTPSLGMEEMYELMAEAEDCFEVEFDAVPPPLLDLPPSGSLVRCWQVDLDEPPRSEAEPPAAARSQAFTIWLRSANFERHQSVASSIVRQVLADNPFTTLQIVLEPRDRQGRAGPSSVPTLEFLDMLLRTASERPTYLDRFYSTYPGPPAGAKRLVVLLAEGDRSRIEGAWIDAAGDFATLVWRGDSKAGAYPACGILQSQDCLSST